MQPKPGIKTTEFWVTIATQIIGLLAVTGVLSPDTTNTLQHVVPQIVGGIAQVATAALYIHSRGKVKSNGGQK